MYNYKQGTLQVGVRPRGLMHIFQLFIGGLTCGSREPKRYVISQSSMGVYLMVYTLQLVRRSANFTWLMYMVIAVV